MGATVTTGKQAAAFRRQDGEVIYILFEKTYEKNVYPHTSYWSCCAIGEYADVMRYVIVGAGDCASGMLKSSRGDILPEKYITDWQRELKKPVLIEDIAIDLKVGDGMYSTISREQEDAARKALENIGRCDVFESIDNNGSKMISLHQDADVVLALYGVKKLFAPWKILEHHQCLSLVSTDMGFTTGTETVQQPMVKAYRLFNDQDNILVKIDGKEWNRGWRYSQMIHFLSTVVYDSEMKQTGCARELITKFRELCQDPPALPAGTRITIHRAGIKQQGVSKWNIKKADHLAQLLGIVKEGEPAPASFEVEAGAVAPYGVYNSGKEPVLLYLADDQLVWNVPETGDASSVQMKLVA